MHIVSSAGLYTLTALRLLACIELCKRLARQKDSSSMTEILILSYHLQSQVCY